MTFKIYRARTAGEALAQVKKDLGASAVILGSRTIQSGGFLGFGRRRLTEITATTRDLAPYAPRPARSAQKPSPRSPKSAPTNPSQPRLEPKVLVEPLADSLSDTVELSAPPPRAPAVKQTVSAPAAVATAPLPSDPLAGATTATPMREVARMIVDATERPQIEEEIVCLKRMVGQVLRTTRGQGGAKMPEALFQCYLKLMESEVAGEITDEIIGKVRDELGADELDDPEIVRTTVLRQVASYIPVSDDVMRVGRAEDTRPTTIALIGPTGVGKTTTVAKLAATYKLRHGRQVGLVTCDTYRIAAVDQLRTYANIIGIDLKVVLTPREMAAACDALSGCDVILIDTAGRAPRDSGRLSELQGFLAAAKPHQTHLVLSSAASQSCLEQAAAQFGSLGCDRVIFTKLDEAVNFGVLINIATRLTAKLSFVTTGQEVPDHIEAGNADRLARFVLGQEGVG